MHKETTSTVVRIGIVVERIENGNPAKAMTATTKMLAQIMTTKEISKGEKLEKIRLKTKKQAINPKTTKLRSSVCNRSPTSVCTAGVPPIWTWAKGIAAAAVTSKF